MKKLLFEFEIDDLQPEDEIEASDVYGLMYQRFPLSLVRVKAVEHSVQADGLDSEPLWCKACNDYHYVVSPCPKRRRYA